MFPLHVETIVCSLIEQMDGAHFPVSPENLPSQCQYIAENGMAFLREHGFTVSRIAINHPAGGYGYRIENDGRSVVYLTDNELVPPPHHRATDLGEFVRFCRNADVLIHDAQYVEKDTPEKLGWGHSLAKQACALAEAVEVKHLVLFHHDPDRTDDALDSIQRQARSWLQANDRAILCTTGYEGLTLEA